MSGITMHLWTLDKVCENMNVMALLGLLVDPESLRKFTQVSFIKVGNPLCARYNVIERGHRESQESTLIAEVSER